MADDRSKKGPQDRSRINLSERYEVDYWTKEFGISESKLEAAVKAVGSSAEAVREYLKRHQ
ncbi:DUF3606 domain-containing protein [Hyphomicrobium sp. 2TAF46]|uniref:DUF3606 domain-containing protein n=1 Tax=Hyphomicrobium sp. 2TAF46 TaxID=3233019 RepID=UPI003F9352AA